jgi:uncharacterized protein YfdQ (DUF2303 family)
MPPPETPAREAESAVILDAGRAIERHRATPKRADVLHGMPYIVLRDENGAERVECLSEQFLRPTFRKGTVKLDDGKSFIAYVERHATGDTAIYAQQRPARFVAVIDEHPATAAAGDQEPNWRQFRAEFSPQLSPEWMTWKSHDRQPFDSTEKFAYFLEDNLPDVIEPNGAELMEVALNFRVNQDVRYSAAQRLQDGHLEVAFQNVVEGSSSTAAGKIRIPELFRIEIPVFAGVESHLYKVDARFRYRLKSEGLKLWFELVRPHKVLEQAFLDLWTEIGDGTQRDILLGTPE